MPDISPDNNTPAETRGRAAPLVPAEPFHELLDELREDANRLEDLAPGHELADVYRKVRERLWRTLRQASEERVWVSTSEAAEHLGVSVSHVQHLCGQDPAERPFTARKVGGAWRIAAHSLASRDAAA